MVNREFIKMNTPKSRTTGFIGLVALMLSSTFWLACLNIANASDEAKTLTPIQIKQHADYSDAGADNCLKCHDADSDYPATKIFETSHAVKADKRSPFAHLQCESCHGPGGDHVVRRVAKGETRELKIDFEREHFAVADLNQICSSCHLDVERKHWTGSEHQQAELTCVDCHQIHVEEDPVQVKHRQVDVCGNCHQQQKLAANRFSTHPLNFEGQMGCTDCHSSHGSVSEHLLTGETVNDTCFQCHAEKRGPFVWEHEPASEDCGTCHSPHGSNQKAMLTLRAPLLCQSCHSSEGHPAIANASSGQSQLASSMLLGRSCTNFHSQVHGSNHPSGSLLQR